MDKKKLLRRIFDVHVWAVAIAIIGVATAIAAVTITAYYPAPYGEYNKLRVMTVGNSYGTIEADAIFDHPANVGNYSIPHNWININGSVIQGALATPGLTYPNLASRLDTLGVKRIFDVDSPPVNPNLWAPILDMNGQSKLQHLEVNGTLTVKGNVIIDRDLTMAGSTSAINCPKIVGTSSDHFGGSGVMLYNNLKVFNDLRVDRNVGIGGTYYKGGSCHAFIDTKDGTKLLASIESPEYKFVDEGQAQLQNGVAKIKIDEIFKGAIETDNYLVFVTAVNDCKGLWVAEKTPDYFIVKEMQDGKSNARFSWQLSGIRKGYKGIRFNPYEEKITAKKSLGDS